MKKERYAYGNKDKTVNSYVIKGRGGKEMNRKMKYQREGNQ